MSDDEIRGTVLRLLGNVAPEADPAQLDPTVSLREQLDIDSMDLLNFMLALHKEFHVEIPERDYPKLMAVDAAVNYLTAAVRSRAAGGKS